MLPFEQFTRLVFITDTVRHPFTASDRAAGYRYDDAIWQAEFSLTQVLDRPISGQVFFEQVIRDNLDAGRHDQIALIFDRQLKRTGPRATLGPFRTRVITEGVRASPHAPSLRICGRVIVPAKPLAEYLARAELH